MVSYQEHIKTIRRDGIDRYVSQFNNINTLLQYQKAYDVSLRYLKKGDFALDWGCGNGHFSYFLTSRGVKTTGYSFDSCPEYLRNNSLFTHIEGLQSNPAELPFEDGQFDVVFSVGVLEHVCETGGSEQKSVKELYRILRPRGHFICCHLPNKYQWVENVGKIIGQLEHFHYRKYDLRDIREMLDSSGFDLKEWGRYGIIPRNQLRRLPFWMRNSYTIANALNFFDKSLSALFPVLCTSYYFVAVKS